MRQSRMTLTGNNNKYLLTVLAVLYLGIASIPARGVSEYVTTTYTTGDVRLVYDNAASDIYVAANEPPAVVRCVKDLAADIQRVTGKLPAIKNSSTGLSAHAIIVGTLDNSALIKSLVSDGKINVTEVQGQWETFQVQTVANPVTGVDMALVIAGSDRRGAVYGMYDVSENIGVSPWYWFADVAPMEQTNLVVTGGTKSRESPSVKYRAIFINDEDWGIRPWSVNTYAKADGGTGLGPTTYRRVFELLLRLKANHIWPAMHQKATPFNYYPENKLVADTFGIVMGSTHIEPLLRNCTAGTEWANEGTGDFNYQTNAANVYSFWEKRIIENGKYENVYTMGKRGSDDQAMPEGGSTSEKVAILEKIFADQRKILKEHVNADLSKVPQIFIPYKEVLTLYYANLVVPDDIIIGWVDDNHGYIRSLSNVTEQARSGGSGVYYHISYWGSPADYLWLCSTPPSLVWAELNKAWEYKARNVWVVNVGDIKPAEIGMEMFLSMAWDISVCTAGNVKQRMQHIAERDFGASDAPEIADILEGYFRLGYARKPEHMNETLFSIANYGDEAQKRLDDYAALEQRATAVYNTMASDLKPAFYQKVLYPLRGAMLMNQKFIYAQKSNFYADQKRASAASYGSLAKKAYDAIQTETSYYNQTMSSGKWNRIMSSNPRGLAVFNAPSVSNYSGSGSASLNVYCEGGSATTLPSISGYNRDSAYIDLYNTGTGTIDWSTTTSAAWIRLSESSGSFSGDTRVWVSVDWNSVPTGTSLSGSISITGGGATKTVAVPIFNPASPARNEVTGFMESNKYISMEAEHFSRVTDRQSAGWRIVGGLGRTGDGVMVLPTTLAAITTASALQSSSPVMEYDFYTFTTGNATIRVYSLPNQSVGRDELMRYAVAIDNGSPQIVDVGGSWDVCVLQAARIGNTSVSLSTTGRHMLKVWMVDPGLVVDKIVIDFGGVKASYFGPPESFASQIPVKQSHHDGNIGQRIGQPGIVRSGMEFLFFNPFKRTCILSLYNARGQQMYRRAVMTEGITKIPQGYFGAGIYFYRIVWEKGERLGNIVMLKR
ncbi:MAG: glycosyl hydrolase 115 family protein [Chitinispirillaceae bacterium]|nr:glycosyl hydrolase 115 family protein [Chitinispirillaceae bacterium]